METQELRQAENSQRNIIISFGVVGGFLLLISVASIVALAIYCHKRKCRDKVSANELNNIGILTGNLKKYSENPNFIEEHKQIMDKLDQLSLRVETDAGDESQTLLKEARERLDEFGRVIASIQDKKVPIGSESEMGRHQDNQQRNTEIAMGVIHSRV